MKTLVRLLLVLISIVSMTGLAHGRNVELIVPIADALAASDIKDRPTGAVKFYFAEEKAPNVAKNLGSYLAAPRTGASGKSDQRACHEAFLWTLLNLEDRALRAGANAVVNIVSYYKRKERSSVAEFECHVGNVIVTVWLKGDLVRLGE